MLRVIGIVSHQGAAVNQLSDVLVTRDAGAHDQVKRSRRVCEAAKLRLPTDGVISNRACVLDARRVAVLLHPARDAVAGRQA